MQGCLSAVLCHPCFVGARLLCWGPFGLADPDEAPVQGSLKVVRGVGVAPASHSDAVITDLYSLTQGLGSSPGHHRMQAMSCQLPTCYR